jgi:hypothetical protein
MQSKDFGEETSNLSCLKGERKLVNSFDGNFHPVVKRKFMNRTEDVN